MPSELKTSHASVPAYSGLMPHPPIVVPPVGRDRGAECSSTTRACEEFARRMVQAQPDRLFVVSPHAPRRADGFGLFAGSRLTGDLGRFGAPDAAVDLENDEALVAAIGAAAAEHGVGTYAIARQPLDHGAVVPLWFLVEAGWAGPTVVASLPWDAPPAVHAAFGRVVAIALSGLPGRAALVASGDMTHRAKPGAPAGYEPRAVEFDRALTVLAREGRLAEIPEIDPELRALAAEDAADSSTVIAAAIGFDARGAEVLSYEHPFGVGYLVAVFHDGAES